MTYHINPGIRTPEDLGIAYLGSPHTAVVPPKCPTDRAEYGRRLAKAEGGIFTPFGYLTSNKDEEELKCQMNAHAKDKGAIFLS